MQAARDHSSCSFLSCEKNAPARPGPIPFRHRPIISAEMSWAAKLYGRTGTDMVRPNGAVAKQMIGD
jgi:hypothetical protein